MDEIDNLATRICDALAGAIATYARISGEFEELMPEHFAVAYIMQTLGDTTCMTMESSARTLWEWNRETKVRMGKSFESGNLPQALIDDCGGQRCDLVVFYGPDFSRKHTLDLFCLVELKKGHVSEADIAKINTWLPYIDTCPYGMVSSYCEVPKFDSYVRECADKARADGHFWLEGRIATVEVGDEEVRKFATFARYWKRQAG